MQRGTETIKQQQQQQQKTETDGGHTYQNNRNTSSCLDLVITQSPQMIKRVDVLPAICSDHTCAFLQNNITISFKRTIYSYNKSNNEKLCNSLSSIDWLNVTTGRTIDECTDLFTEFFTNIARQCMPFKVVTVRSKDVHWLTSEIRELITHTHTKKGIDSIVEPSGVN